jgi:hypothetical protein
MNFLRCEQRQVKSRIAGLQLLLLLAFTSSPAHPQGGRFAGQRQRSLEHTDPVHDRVLSLDVRSNNPPTLAADTVVQKLMATGARRSAELRGFRATRTYDLQYHGFLGTREAGMRVISTYTAPDKVEFSVVSEYGSKLLLNRVLMKLLDSEREAFRNQSQIELSPANYTFDSLGMEQADSDPCYVLSVQPRKDNKFLYRGKVWVDTNDFALARMEGQPAKSPSFWIKDTQIDSTWKKVGEFWLIQHSRSVSHIRLGGTATLTIDYTDYQITGVGRPHGQGQNPQLPDPSSVTPQR